MPAKRSCTGSLTNQNSGVKVALHPPSQRCVAGSRAGACKKRAGSLCAPLLSTLPECTGRSSDVSCCRFWDFRAIFPRIYVHVYLHSIKVCKIDSQSHIIWIYIYIHIYTYTCIHAFMHACMHACLHTYIHRYIYLSIDRSIYLSLLQWQPRRDCRWMS